MVNRPNTAAQRKQRHARVRGKISGTPERPRLCVFRSESNIYAQVIDDVNGNTLVSASSVEKDFEGNGGNVEAAKKIGSKSALLRRVLKKWSSTAADISITDASRLWPKLPARAA